MKQHYLLTFFAIIIFSGIAAQPAADYAIQVSATTQVSPPQIKLYWKKVSGVSSYAIFRKAKQATAWSTLVSLTAADSIYADNSVAVDTAYEYQVAGNGPT